MSDRRLPNFLVLGAAKAGTTSLYHYIQQHPDVFLPRVKEPHFFSNEEVWNRGLEAYLRDHFSGAERFSARGEATPHYLFYEKAAQRIAAVLPKENQRFIVVLRDPVTRAYSLYWNMRHEGHETRSFQEAVESGLEGEVDLESERLGTVRKQYIRSGLYAAQLRAYLSYFALEQFLILLSDDLASNPEGTMRRVFNFLNVDDSPRVSAPRVTNAAATPRVRALQTFMREPNRLKRALGRMFPNSWKRSVATRILELNRRKLMYPPMPPEVEASLRRTFRSDILELEELTGLDLRRWR